MQDVVSLESQRGTTPGESSGNGEALQPWALGLSSGPSEPQYPSWKSVVGVTRPGEGPAHSALVAQLILTFFSADTSERRGAALAGSTASQAPRGQACVDPSFFFHPGLGAEGQRASYTYLRSGCRQKLLNFLKPYPPCIVSQRKNLHLSPPFPSLAEVQMSGPCHSSQRPGSHPLPRIGYGRHLGCMFLSVCV